MASRWEELLLLPYYRLSWSCRVSGWLLIGGAEVLLLVVNIALLRKNERILKEITPLQQ